MIGYSSGITMIQASTLRQLLETAPASVLSELEDMVIFDTRTMRAISYDKKDFVGPIMPIKATSWHLSWIRCGGNRNY